MFTLTAARMLLIMIDEFKRKEHLLNKVNKILPKPQHG
jgi:hypothetical protein